MTDRPVHPRRIVVADDEPAMRAAIADLLVDAGHTVVAAVDNGADAVTAALECAPDVVLTDLRMPGMSGTDVARTLAMQRPDLPVIILTAYEDMQQQLSVERSPVAAFLVKGGPSWEIFAAIDAATPGSGARPSPVGPRP